ncbi:unnamed protein product [marine sediment metagenome]|uniref:HhH-GPD domain-containing protein n=1 Tax=marine sediment metagenome TaxID=412755 RepID=X1DK95_9ZZZZ
MNNSDIQRVMKILKEEVKQWKPPIVGEIERHFKDPYRVLISCLLSLRTKDKVTGGASTKLFSLADNPYSMLKLSPAKIMKAIYPVGFYRRKAKAVRIISKILIEKHNGIVPDSMNLLFYPVEFSKKIRNF